MDKYKKLIKLKSLLDSGLLSEEEFNDFKNEILFDAEFKNNFTSKQTNNVDIKSNNNSYSTQNETVNNAKKIYVFFIISFFVLIIGLNLKNNSSKIKEVEEETLSAPSEVVVNPEPTQQAKSYEQIQREKKRKQILEQQDLEIARIRAQNQILSNMRKNGASVEDVSRTTDAFNSTR
jgi:preprotein translocase subunit SecG